MIRARETPEHDLTCSEVHTYCLYESEMTIESRKWTINDVYEENIGVYLLCDQYFSHLAYAIAIV